MVDRTNCGLCSMSKHVLLETYTVPQDEAKGTACDAMRLTAKLAKPAAYQETVKFVVSAQEIKSTMTSSLGSDILSRLTDLGTLNLYCDAIVKKFRPLRIFPTVGEETNNKV